MVCILQGTRANARPVGPRLAVPLDEVLKRVEEERHDAVTRSPEHGLRWNQRRVVLEVHEPKL